MISITSLQPKQQGNMIQRDAEQLVSHLRHLIMLTEGVLTKADTVQQDEHGPWLRIMTGKSHVLRRGYYMTRILPLTPKDEAENKTMAGKEKGFFSRSPWKELIKTGRLGTDKLTEALSLALEEMIKNKSSSN